MASSPSPPAPFGRSPLRKLWLGVTVVLFAAWISWLAYLAFTSTKPVVLSRPQFLISKLDVIAELDSLDGLAKIEEVSWPKTDATKQLIGAKIQIENLNECQDRGWDGAGSYILPLVSEGKSYYIAPIPPSPGFRGGKGRIYRATAETRAQLQQISKPKD